MFGRRAIVATVGFAALTVGAVAAEVDYWTGPYIGPTYGWGVGTASYVFATDGWYNNAPGDTFEQPLSSTPIGGVLGYNWRRGAFVYGLEAFIHSHGVAADGSCLVLFPAPPPGPCGDPSPFIADQELDIKGHWFTGVNVRVGLARDRWLVYAQGGPVLGHLVSSMQDLANDINITEYKTPASVFGLTGEVGVQFALTTRVSFGFGIRGTYLRPLRVNTESIDNTTGMPAGPDTATDHTAQLAPHALVAGLIYRGGQGSPDRRNTVPFDWAGPYWGIYAGALWQLGLQAGYDHVFGGHYLAGINAQASLNICCGFAIEGDLNARIGYIWRDDVLFYAEAGVSMHTGTFFWCHRWWVLFIRRRRRGCVHAEGDRLHGDERGRPIGRRFDRREFSGRSQFSFWQTLTEALRC